MSSRSPTKGVLASRPLRRYLITRVLSTSALEMCTVALGWEVYERTSSALHLGYIGAAQFVSTIAFTLVGGQAADRFDRRTVGVLAVLGMAVCAALLALQAANPEVLGLWLCYALAAALGLFRAFLGPAANALLSHVVPPEHLASAVGWQLIGFQIGMSAGPAAGGVLYAAFGAGAVVYGVAATLLCVAALSLSGVPRDPLLSSAARRAAASGGERPDRGLLAGARYVIAKKPLLGALTLDLVAVLLGGAVALLPVFARDVLSVGPSGLGALRAAPAVGAALTALLLTQRPVVRRAGPVMLACVFGYGLATAAFGVSTHFGFSLACLALVGAFDMVQMTVRHTMVQLSTPNEMRGRVSAITSLCAGASNELGALESGVLAQWVGPVRAVVFGGVGACLVVVAWRRVFPELLAVDTPRLREAEA